MNYQIGYEDGYEKGFEEGRKAQGVMNIAKKTFNPMGRWSDKTVMLPGYVLLENDEGECDLIFADKIVEGKLFSEGLCIYDPEHSNMRITMSRPGVAARHIPNE